MGLVLVTAHLAAPVVLSADDLHLDGLLVSAHPSSRSAPVGRETSGAALRLPSIPVAHATLEGSRIALVTVAEAPSEARLVTEHTIKRRDGEDLSQLAKGVNLALGPGKNRMHRLTALATPTLAWRAIGTPRELLKLLRRHLFLGPWRSAGYGAVARWEARYLDDDPSTVLVRDGMAQRSLPASWTTWRASVVPGALVPPYWHPARMLDAVVAPGTPCALTPAIEDLVHALADPTTTRAHAGRHRLKRTARAIDATHA